MREPPATRAGLGMASGPAPTDPWRNALGTRATAVERASLGGRHILHSPTSGAILSTDECGLAILSDPVRPLDPAAALPQEVMDTILRSWEAAGLFATAPEPFPDPVADDGRSAGYARRYATGRGALSLRTDDPVLARQVDEILWNFAAPAAEACPDPLRLRCVGCAGGGLGLFRDGGPIWGRASRDTARYLIVREAAEALCGADQVGAVLHGAAVLAPGGDALLILGDSGRGKSTLAQGLVAAGCGFLADDHLPLHVDGRRLLSFPTGSAVKPGGRDLDEVRRLLARHGMRGRHRGAVGYLPLEGAAPPGAAVPVSAIVFPEHVAGAAPGLARMDPEAAFTAAIASGTRPARRTATIRPLVDLFAAVPAHALRYGTSSQSVAACLDLLAA